MSEGVTVINLETPSLSQCGEQTNRGMCGQPSLAIRIMVFHNGTPLMAHYRCKDGHVERKLLDP